MCFSGMSDTNKLTISNANWLCAFILFTSNIQVVKFAYYMICCSKIGYHASSWICYGLVIWFRCFLVDCLPLTALVPSLHCNYCFFIAWILPWNIIQIKSKVAFRGSVTNFFTYLTLRPVIIVPPSSAPSSEWLITSLILLFGLVVVLSFVFVVCCIINGHIRISGFLETNSSFICKKYKMHIFYGRCRDDITTTDPYSSFRPLNMINTCSESVILCPAASSK